MHSTIGVTLSVLVRLLYCLLSMPHEKKKNCANEREPFSMEYGNFSKRLFFLLMIFFFFFPSSLGNFRQKALE